MHTRQASTTEAMAPRGERIVVAICCDFLIDQAARINQRHGMEGIGCDVARNAETCLGRLHRLGE
jgi:hypothetical protein